MIDTNKIMRTTKILLHGRYINQREADDYLELIAEVKRLQAWKKLVSDIVQQQDGSHLREMLKELIE